jgi:hypothetical protein
VFDQIPILSLHVAWSSVAAFALGGFTVSPIVLCYDLRLKRNAGLVQQAAGQLRVGGGVLQNQHMHILSHLSPRPSAAPIQLLALLRSDFSFVITSNIPGMRSNSAALLKKHLAPA